jgi:hypothetical protein
LSVPPVRPSVNPEFRYAKKADQNVRSSDGT